MDVKKAADELTALRLAVGREVQEFTERTGIVITLSVEPQFRKDRTFDLESGTLPRLIGYQVTDRIEALASMKAAG